MHTLLGLVNLILGLVYLILPIVLLVKRANRSNPLAIILYIIQAILSPILLSSSGIILLYQGWRLDPILLFSFFLLTLVILYLGSKDILIENVEPDR